MQQETGAPAKVKIFIRPAILQRQNANISCQAIFLVGGFGANKYLKSRLQACMGGIAVLQPEDAYENPLSYRSQKMADFPGMEQMGCCCQVRV